MAMAGVLLLLALLMPFAAGFHHAAQAPARRPMSSLRRLRMETETSPTTVQSIRTTLSALEVAKAEGFPGWDARNTDKVATLLGLATGDQDGGKKGDAGAAQLSLRLLQRTNGPVPRSYLPTLIVIEQHGADTTNVAAAASDLALYALIEEGVKWYLDCGGRASRLELSVPAALADVAKSMGFRQPQDPPAEALLLRDHAAAAVVADPAAPRVVLACDAARLKEHCEARAAGQRGAGNLHALHDIAGRLAHDLGDPRAAIRPYTASLQAYPQSAAVFRNMGAAYHAVGDMQLAFASYQQAVQLDESDALVYLKLAFFYEDFATKDWVDAADHAQKCYEYYVDKVDPGDTAVLTRLGNLLVREHRPERAVDVYARVLEMDPGLENVWFNKAHAQIATGDVAGAAESLRKTLALDPTVVAARQMLRALSEEEATTASASEDGYVRDLFDTYAQVYDAHVKKLLYSATRVIRQELAKIYRARHGLFDRQESPAFSLSAAEREEVMRQEAEAEQQRKDAEMVAQGGYQPMGDVSSFKEASAPVGSSCSSYSSFMNASLDILDIGCGTGLAGAWLKDYARSLVGVDLSEQMVNVARKKMLYQELHVQPLNAFLEGCDRTFDLVVAADVLSYVGDLQSTFDQVARVLRPGGLFAFTVESAPETAVLAERGYRLLRSGRFGYSKSYVDSVVAKLRPPFTAPLARDFSPHLDAGEPVPGFLYIIQKEG